MDNRRILFLHGSGGSPRGRKVQFLRDDCGYDVDAPHLPEDFRLAVEVARRQFRAVKYALVVGSSSGCGVALKMLHEVTDKSTSTRLILLSPCVESWMGIRSIPRDAVVLHSAQDEIIPLE